MPYSGCKICAELSARYNSARLDFENSKTWLEGFGAERNAETYERVRRMVQEARLEAELAQRELEAHERTHVR
jgi:uncharacterized protein (DUF849 family)